MAYADYDFYLNTYFGNAVSEEDFPRLSERASDYVRAATRGISDTVDGWQMDAVKKASCAVADALLDEEIMKFQSSLREVMFFIKYSKDRENLSRILKVNEKRFREVERRAADVIEAITNSGIKYEEGEEAVDVCQAIQEMRKESEQDGELKKAREAAGRLYEMGLDTEKIAQAVGYAVETVKGWLGLSEVLP